MDEIQVCVLQRRLFRLHIGGQHIRHGAAAHALRSVHARCDVQALFLPVALCQKCTYMPFGCADKLFRRAGE